MTNLRLSLCLWLLDLADWVYPGDDERVLDKAVAHRADAVVNANVEPKWTPHQDGQVVIAEPKLVSIERAQRGDEALQSMLDEL